MTDYAIVWTDAAKAQLRSLDGSIQTRIVKRVDLLARDPLRQVSRLVNSPLFTLRVGDFRIIVAIEKKLVTVVVVQVVHRRTAYR